MNVAAPRWMALPQHPGVGYRVLALPERISTLIDVPFADSSAELLWTAQKARTPALSALVLTTGTAPIADGGFDDVHRMVEAAAQQVGQWRGEDVGPIEIAIVDVNNTTTTTQQLDDTTGPWEVRSRHGARVRLEPRTEDELQ